LPSTVKSVVEFEDRGRTYTVDTGTGRVTFVESSDIQPIPPAPPKPNPDPVAPLNEMAARVKTLFEARVTAPDRRETAQELAQCITVTLAKAGGLSLKGQAVIDDLADGIDDRPGLRQRLQGFPLGEALTLAVGDDEARLTQALKDAKAGLEAVR